MSYKRIVLDDNNIENLSNLLNKECKNCAFIKYDNDEKEHYCERYKGYVTYSDVCIEEGI